MTQQIRPMHQADQKPAASAGPPWLDQLFTAIDTQDTAAFLRFLAPDAQFRFGSSAMVRGHAAIGHAVDGFFASIAGCQHRLHKVWQQADSLVCAGEVSYRRHDGSGISLPFANVLELAGERITGYFIYADLGPLYAPGQP